MTSMPPSPTARRRLLTRFTPDASVVVPAALAPSRVHPGLARCAGQFVGAGPSPRCSTPRDDGSPRYCRAPRPTGCFFSVSPGENPVNAGRHPLPMLDASTPCPHAVLAVVLRPRFVGVATVCRDGLPSRGFQCWNLRRFRSEAERVAAFTRLFTDRVATTVPNTLVLAVDDNASPRVKLLAARARSLARDAQLSVVERPSGDAARAILGRYPARRRDDLPRALARVFPGLAEHVGARGDRERYYGPAWRALGLAHAALSSLCPACSSTSVTRSSPTSPL